MVHTRDHESKTWVGKWNCLTTELLDSSPLVFIHQCGYLRPAEFIHHRVLAKPANWWKPMLLLGYCAFHCGRPHRKGGGVMLYAPDHPRPSVVNLSPDASPTHGLETILIHLHLRSHTFLVFCICRSHSILSTDNFQGLIDAIHVLAKFTRTFLSSGTSTVIVLTEMPTLVLHQLTATVHLTMQ